MSEAKQNLSSCLCPAKPLDTSPATPARKQPSEAPVELATSLEPETPAKLESRRVHVTSILGVSGFGKAETQERPGADAAQRAASGSIEDPAPADSWLPEAPREMLGIAGACRSQERPGAEAVQCAASGSREVPADPSVVSARPDSRGPRSAPWGRRSASWGARSGWLRLRGLQGLPGLPSSSEDLPWILLVRLSLGLDDSVMALAVSSKSLMNIERQTRVSYKDFVSGGIRCLFGYWKQHQNFLFWFASQRHVGLSRSFRSSFRINQGDLKHTYRITLMSPLKELCVETQEDLFFEKGRVLNQYGLDQTYALPDAIRRFKGSPVYSQRSQPHLRESSNYWFSITVSPTAASFTKCDGRVAHLRWGPDAWLIFRAKWCPQHHATYKHSVTGSKCVKFHVQRLD